MHPGNEADRRIKGYQHIDQESIDLINELKEHGKTSAALQQKVADKLTSYYTDLWRRIDEQIRLTNDDLVKNGLFPKAFAVGQVMLTKANAAGVLGNDHPLIIELENYDRANPSKWADLGLTDFQTATMFLVRAVARNPEG